MLVIANIDTKSMSIGFKWNGEILNKKDCLTQRLYRGFKMTGLSDHGLDKALYRYYNKKQGRVYGGRDKKETYLAFNLDHMLSRV